MGNVYYHMAIAEAVGEFIPWVIPGSDFVKGAVSALIVAGFYIYEATKGKSPNISPKTLDDRIKRLQRAVIEIDRGNVMGSRDEVINDLQMYLKLKRYLNYITYVYGPEHAKSVMNVLNDPTKMKTIQEKIIREGVEIRREKESIRNLLALLEVSFTSPSVY